MGLGDWIAQKAGLAGHDIVNLPGATMHLGEAVDPSQIIAGLISGQVGPGTAFHRYMQANRQVIGGTYQTARHPLRDPFQTAMLLLPFAKGLGAEGAASEAGSGLSLHDLVPNRASHTPEELVKNLRPFDIGQSMLEGRLGRMKENQPRAFREGNPQLKHDLLFGGEVHARGPIPSGQLSKVLHSESTRAFTEPPSSTAEVVQRIASRNRNVAQMLHAHGMSEHTPQGQPDFVEHIRQVIHTDRMPDQARVYAGKKIRSGISPKENLLGGGDRAVREEALRRILQAHLHNHPN